MQYVCNLRTTDNGNRTELSPILSVIVLSDYKLDDYKVRVQFVDHEYDYRPNGTTESPVTD